MVGQHLVNVVEETEARGCRLQTVQPQRVSTHPQKMCRMQVHQVIAVMLCCSLEVTETGSEADRLSQTLSFNLERCW